MGCDLGMKNRKHVRTSCKLYRIDTSKNFNMIVIVDLGYLTFYRMHATLRYLKHQHIIDESQSQEETSASISEKEKQDTFVKLYEKHLVSQLDKLKKKYKTARAFYFCKDEKQRNVWRVNLFPEYKANRGVADDLIKRLQAIVMTTVPRYGRILAGDKLEADDVAFLTVKHIRKIENDTKSNEMIVIVTSDRDYLQMLDKDMIIVDGSGKEIVGCGDPKVDLWTKVLMGDVSDNIPAVCKGCGKKTAATLASDSVKRAAYIEKKQCQERVTLNQTLIDMKNIPQDLSDAFYKSLCL